MKEIQAILEAWRTSQKLGEPCVLVTVVKTEGSTYRKAGARMLVTFDRQTHGMVSGGCLEQLLGRDAFDRTAQEKTVFFRFANSSEDDDLRWASGCHGTFHVLLERIEPGESHAGLELIERLRKDRNAGVLATVFSSSVEGLALGATLGVVSGEVPAERCLPGSAGELFSSMVLRDAGAMLETMRGDLTSGVGLTPRKPTGFEYSTPEGRVEILISPIVPPARLLLCGSGHDAQPLARFAKELGWETVVFDTRGKSATASRFPDSVVTVESPDQVTKYVDSWTACAIMTHRFADDVDLLGFLLPMRLPYLGVLGPRNRTQRLLSAVAEKKTVTTEDAARLHGPIGIDIGAESPEQIALAIIAEILAVFSGRPMPVLKNKTGPIQPQTEGTAQCNR